jgi:hypothetical protein
MKKGIHTDTMIPGYDKTYEARGKDVAQILIDTNIPLS